MIKLPPKQSLYLKEMLTGKPAKEIAAQLGVSYNTYIVTISQICRKLKMTKIELMKKYFSKEIEFDFTNIPQIKEYKIENDKRFAGRIEQIKAMRRLGFTEKEIIEELNDA